MSMRQLLGIKKTIDDAPENLAKALAYAEALSANIKNTLSETLGNFETKMIEFCAASRSLP